MNLADTFRFVEIVQEKMRRLPGIKLILCTDFKSRNLTNAIYLMGAFLVITKNHHPEKIWKLFQSLESELEMYRDATFKEARFRLSVLDCWGGLAKAQALGWTKWYDMLEYSHYDNPLEGDLHTIVPGKLIAFKGPRSLSHTGEYEDLRGCRNFSSSFFADIFATEMNVSTVIRLNEETYDTVPFKQSNIDCIDLEFEDCTDPPTHIIVEFLHTVERARGVVAVHCKAGLGRTGTLIALYMMKHHGFTAREAIGWLRIVRPGSVIGQQQQFLCDVESTDPANGKPLPDADADSDSDADTAYANAAGDAGSTAGDDSDDRADAAAQVTAALESAERITQRAAHAARRAAGTGPL